MPSRVPTVFLALLLALSSVTNAHAASQFLLRIAPADIGPVAGTYGLTVLSADNELGLYRVSAAADYDTIHDQLEDDPRVIDIEHDSEVDLPETRRKRVDPPSGSLGSLPARSVVSHFGNQVWAGYVTQPATNVIGLAKAQRSFATGVGIVAVIDTGVDPTHPALSGVIVPGYDFILDTAEVGAGDIAQDTAAILEGGPGARPLRAVPVNASTLAIVAQDTAAILEGGDRLPEAFGHGTMVAGLVHLVAPTAQIMPLRAFRSDGTASTYDIVRSIYWAVDHGARVINMSFTLSSASPALVRAINYATEHNVLCVASAGNGGEETLLFPSALRNVIGVGSTSLGDARSLFSNYGSALVKIAAPGEGLITTYPGQHYAAVWGTSFSTALVSGAAALMVEVRPTLDPAKAEESLLKTGAAKGTKLGGGRLDLYATLKAAKR